MGDHKCVYCEHWLHSPIRRKDEKGNKTVTRICRAKKRRIKPDSNSCKYFKPNDYFYCDNYNQWLHILNCLQRRRNSKGFKAWDECKKCRQFEMDLKELISDYFVERNKIVEIKFGRKIKRRKGKEKKPVRTIKRRSTSQKPRKIKRRSRLTKELNTLLPKKSIRKIKRRK